MSKIIKIEVNQETVNYIQGINLEANSRKTLLNSIAETLGVTSKAFRDYQKEFIAYDAEYQLIRDELQRVYVPVALQTHDFAWNLDFQTNLMVIEVRCQCGIDLVNKGIDLTPNFEDNVIAKFSKEDTTEDASCACEGGTCGCEK